MVSFHISTLDILLDALPDSSLSLFFCFVLALKCTVFLHHVAWVAPSQPAMPRLNQVDTGVRKKNTNPPGNNLCIQVFIYNSSIFNFKISEGRMSCAAQFGVISYFLCHFFHHCLYLFVLFVLLLQQIRVQCCALIRKPLNRNLILLRPVTHSLSLFTSG